MKLTLIVSLYINSGCQAEFEQFESAAVKIMGRYGGRIECRLVCAQPDNQPSEVHLVTFPDAESFERYREDADLRALSELRSRAIRATTIWHGTDAPAFGQPDA
jgi:antibiotic biosynthesis monooxygenase (ABM) superfamily enzyme